MATLSSAELDALRQRVADLSKVNPRPTADEIYEWYGGSNPISRTIDDKARFVAARTSEMFKDFLQRFGDKL
jgi:hypothetical protein